MRLGLIWAQSTAGVIGRDGGLPWRLPEDLRHFRDTTMGHPVIVGRRTWESLPPTVRPLPGRPTIVLSRDPAYAAPGAALVATLDAAVARAAAYGTGQAWVAGGAAIYREALPRADTAEVTEVHVEVDGDTYAPGLTGWRCAAVGDWRVSTTGLRYRHLRYER